MCLAAYRGLPELAMTPSPIRFSAAGSLAGPSRFQPGLNLLPLAYPCSRHGWHCSNASSTVSKDGVAKLKLLPSKLIVAVPCPARTVLKAFLGLVRLT